MEDVRRVFQHLVPSPWTAYTPLWTAAAVDPTLGNAALTGRYASNHAWCAVCLSLTFGSTSAAGTGEWYLSLPEPADTTILVVGSVLAYDLSATTYRVGGCEQADTGRLRFWADSAAAAVGGGVPFTWAAGDILRAQVLYPIL